MFFWHQQLDIDNDGILNSLDLDADGDGCSDAIEAGSSTTATSTSVYPTGADTNTNGLLNNYEGTTPGTINYTSTYVSYALNNSINACTDNDGDGVKDVFDLDDDNDGVLDTFEMGCGQGITITGTNGGVKAENTAPPGWINAVSSPDIADATGHVYGTWNVGCTGTAPLPPNGHLSWMSFFSNTQEAFKTTLNNLVPNKTYTLKVNYGKFAALGVGLGQVTTKLGTTVIDQYTPSLGCGWETRTITFTATATSQELQFQNTGPTSATWNTNISISADAIFPVCADIDTDNDGIPNRLDLDSDGDNCADAIEAGSSTTATSTSVYSTGTDTNTNGLLNNYEGGTAGTVNYTSTYTNYALSNTENACIDFDNDGVKDIIDLDDDNDGVLDILEDKVCSTLNINGSLDWKYWNVPKTYTWHDLLPMSGTGGSTAPNILSVVNQYGMPAMQTAPTSTGVMTTWGKPTGTDNGNIDVLHFEGYLHFPQDVKGKKVPYDITGGAWIETLRPGAFEDWKERFIRVYGDAKLSINGDKFIPSNKKIEALNKTAATNIRGAVGTVD